MNCCNDYGKCTGGYKCPARAECSLPCSAPTAQQRYPFAPGVIDQGVIDQGVEPGSRLALVVATVLVLAFLGALAATLGFIAGYINLPGGLQ
ncbi:MAG: hypothetical protein Q8J78_08020 [Moraxellaceae bacterium]|nr:hypothetical protein [Moraxellaceae bacterium]